MEKKKVIDLLDKALEIIENSATIERDDAETLHDIIEDAIITIIYN